MRWSAAVCLAGAIVIAVPTPALVAVIGAAAQSKPLDQPFTLKPGESASIGAERVQVAFERVLSDSRCPRDVQCIQAGEAVVRVQLTIPGRERQMLDLSTSRDRETANVGSYTLSLTALDPVPLASKPTKPADYRATLVLRRN